MRRQARYPIPRSFAQIPVQSGTVTRKRERPRQGESVARLRMRRDGKECPARPLADQKLTPGLKPALRQRQTILTVALH